MVFLYNVAMRKNCPPQAIKIMISFILSINLLYTLRQRSILSVIGYSRIDIKHEKLLFLGLFISGNLWLVVALNVS